MSNDPLIGRDIEGRYKILEKIGGGGMGVVYRAHHALLNVDVALKVIRPNFAETAEARERFLREARAATALTHRNVVAVREVGEFEGKLFLTMDLVKGRTLQDVMGREGRMSIGRAVSIVGQILEALEEAHGRGIVHRDLKPGNIMLEEGDTVRVLDFGLAKWVGEAGTKDQLTSLTGTGTTVGTLQYMAPEQVAGDAIDGRADLYAVAVMLYQMLTGSPPHVAESNQALMRKIVLEPPRPITELGAFPPALATAVMRGLEKEPKHRTLNAGDFRRALEGAGGLTATAMRVMPTMERPAAPREVVMGAKPARRTPWAAIAAVLVLAGAGGFFGWKYWQSQKYERNIREGRAAIDDRRWDDAVAAYEAASKIEDSTEAASGLKKAKFESKKELAKKARTPDDEVKAWEEAARYGEVDDELRKAKVKRGLRKCEEALKGGDVESAQSALDAIADLATEKEERSNLQTLSQETSKAKGAEGIASKAVDAAVALKEIFAERSAWQDYVKAFPKGPRGAEGASRLAAIEADIAKGPGLLIDVDPRGAAVYLDGKRVGSSPMLLRDVPAGKHRLLLSAESRETLEKDIEVSGRLDVRDALAPLMGDLRVTTNVPGADVYIEGPQSLHQRAGDDGATVFSKVLIGAYAVRVEAKAFDAAKGTATVKSRLSETVGLTLVEHPGALFVKTNPVGLEVIVGQGPPQKSPVRIETQPAGEVTLTVKEADGFEHVVKARVRGDEETVVDVDIAALIAEEAKPYDALVQIARTRDPEDTLKACDEFLTSHPNARATGEVKRVKRAMEFLAGRITVKPYCDVELPPMLKSYTPRGWSPAKGDLTHFEFGQSGRRLVFCRQGDSGLEPNSMHIFDFESGQIAGPFPNNAGEPQPAWSRGGRYVCWAKNGNIEIYDTTTAKRTGSVSYGNMKPEDWGFWNTWSWTADDRYLLYSGGMTNGTDSWDEVQAYDPTTGAESWRCKDQSLAYPQAEFSTAGYAVVNGKKKGIINLSGGYVESDATGDYDWRNLVNHYPSRRAAFYSKKGEADVLSVNLYDYAKGVKQKDFEIPANLNNLIFSFDGTRLWGWEGGYGDTAKAAVGVSIDNPADVTRIDLDISRQKPNLGPLYLMVMSRSSTTATDPYERVELYSTASGKRVVEIPGTLTSPYLVDSTDAHMIYLRDGERHVLADARRGQILFDRKGSDINGITPICATGSYILRTNEGSNLYAPGNDKPVCKAAEGQVYFEWGLVISPDGTYSSCNQLGGRESYPTEIRIFDARTMAPILVDRAFLQTLGDCRLHRHGSFWIQEQLNGRLRVWKEIDVLNAVAPEGAALRVTPGALSTAVEDYLNDQPGPATVVKAFPKEKLSEASARLLESFLAELAAGDGGAVSRSVDEFIRQMPKRYAAGLQALILSEAGAALKAGKVKEGGMEALADAIVRGKWNLNVATRLELLPNAKSMIPLFAPLFESTSGESKAKIINRLSELGVLDYLPKVLDTLTSSEWSERYAAGQFVKRHGGTKHLPRVLLLLGHSDRNVREFGLEFLEEWKLAETVPSVAGMLKDPVDSVRRKALYTIGNFKNADLAIHVLPFLKDPDKYSRVAATDALESMEAKGAVGEIEPLLSDPEAYVISNAVQALGALDYDRYVDRIIEAMRHKDADVRNSAFSTVRPGLSAARLDRVSELLKDPQNRLAALRLLIAQGRKEHVAALAEYLLDADKDVRYRTASFLEEHGDRSAVPRLRGALQDSDEYVRREALDALAKFRATESVPDILPLLKNASENTRSQALAALVILRAKEAVPDLLPLLKDASEGVRSSAAQAIYDLGGASYAYVLVPSLKAKHSWTRRDALNALVESDALAHLKEIEACIDDPDEYVSAAAIRGLATLAYDQSLDRLIAGLTHKNESVRTAAVNSIRMGLDAGRQATVAELLKESAHRFTALRVLVAQGRADLIPDVVAYLEDPDPKVRAAATWLLASYGNPSVEVNLRKALKDADESVRYAAAYGLGQIGTEASIPDLIALFQDAKPGPIAGAITALAELGAKAHMGRIIELLGHKEGWVRSNALTALEKFGDPKIVERAIAFTQDGYSPGTAFDLLRRLDARAGAPALANELMNPKQSYRSYAAHALIAFLARGDDGKTWLDVVEAGLNDRTDPKVRQAAVTVLIAAGRIGKAEQRATLEEFGPNHEVMPTLMAALMTAHERPVARILESVVEAKEVLEGIKGLTALAESNGLRVEFDGRAYSAVRLKRGATWVLGDLLRFYRFDLVPDGKTVKVVRTRAAYEYWMDRLK